MMGLDEKRLKITFDKSCTNNCNNNSFISIVSNVSTRLIVEAELSLGSSEISSEGGSPARRFLMTDDVLSMQTQWAAI